MIALLESRTAGQYGKASWLPNIVAGVVVGVVALPLAMAFAIASGARPEQGIYTAIVAGFLVSVFGGSRVQIAGPTGAFIAILSGITATYGIVGLQIATLMAGVMLVLMGVLRLGGVIKFIPAPVIAGFTVFTVANLLARIGVRRLCEGNPFVQRPSRSTKPASI
jgi:SulP family sulfate permease